MIVFELAQFNGMKDHPKLREHILRRIRAMNRMGQCVLVGTEKCKIDLAALDIFKEFTEDKVKWPNPYTEANKK